MADPVKDRDYISRLYNFLSKKGAMGNVSEDAFVENMQDKGFASEIYKMMEQRKIVKNTGGFDEFYQPFASFYAESQKKSQAEIQAGLGDASSRVSPLSSGVDFSAPLSDVARQTADIAAAQRPPQPQAPEPLAPRTFGGREIPAPVAPGREEQELVRQDVAGTRQQQALQQAGPIARGLQATAAPATQIFGQQQPDFPIKSGDTAIKELEEARKQRQAGKKEEPEIVQMFRGDKNVPSYGKFFENTRMGRMLAQGAEMFGATAAGIGAGALNIPELVANTMENITLDIASAPLRKKLKEGKITQEQFNAYADSARKVARAVQMVAPVASPRRLEYFADNFLNADELEDRARANLKLVQDKIDNADKGLEGLLKEGRYADGIQYAATQAIGSLPYAIAAALPGGVYVVGGVAAQDKYRQIEDEIGAENMRSAETLNALATGITEGLSEAVTAGIVKRAGALVKGIGKGPATKTIKDQIKNVLKATVGSMFEEGASELAAQLSENIIDKATINPDKDLKEGLIDALGIGMVSGAGITGVAGTIGLAIGQQPPPPPPGTPAAPQAPGGTPPPPGAPAAPAGGAGTPPPPGAPSAPRAFGPFGNDAPDASVYAGEILGNYRPENGQLSLEEAQGMVQDYLASMLEITEDSDVPVPPTKGWEKSAYEDIDSRRDEIAQALIGLAATPKPQARAAAPAAPSATSIPSAPFEVGSANAPTADTYAREILNKFQPQGGAVSPEVAKKYAQDYADGFIEIDDDQMIPVEPKAGSLEAAIRNDALARQDEIVQAIIALSQPAQAQAATTPQTPFDGYATTVLDLFGTGQEMTEQEADDAFNQYLNSLTSQDETGKTVYSPEFQDALVNSDKIVKRIVELSKQQANAPQEVEGMQPESGLVQPPGTQEGEQVQAGGQETQPGADVGNIPPVGGMPAEGQVAPSPEETAQLDKSIRDVFNDLWERARYALDEGFAVFAGQTEEMLAAGGDRYYGHGMGKTTIATATRDLLNLFNNGIDPNRGGGALYTAPFAAPPGAGAGFGTSGGPYADGPFILGSSKPSIRDISDVEMILVNEGIVDLRPDIIDLLRKRFPNLIVDRYSNAANAIAQAKAKKQGQQATTQASEITTPPTEITTPPAEEGQAPTPENIEQAPPQAPPINEEALPDDFKPITAEEEAAQEQETIRLFRGIGEARRKAGKYVKNFVEYVRNAIDDISPKGNEGEVLFADNLKQKFTYKLIEADSLQPSHLGNKVNPAHFIPEAQPKDRTKGKDSLNAQISIASKTDPNQLGQNVNAYSGAPIVNNRNEVVQGNNRSAGIKLGYGQNSFGGYKQWLIDNAAQFGFTPEQVSGMQNPVLVREVNVSDERAIELGQYTALDMESGFEMKPNILSLALKMKDKDKAAVLNVIYEDGTEQGDTLRETIRAKWRRILPVLSKYMSGGEKTYMLGRSGDISAQGVAAIEELFEQFMFEGADNDVKRQYTATIPFRVQQALKKSLRFIFSVPVEASLIDDLQDSFIAYGNFYNQRDTGTRDFDSWAQNESLFGASPKEIFSPLAIALAKTYHESKKESDVIDVFKNYAEATTSAGGMFGDVQPLTKAEAVKKIFNVEYETRAEENVAEGTGGPIGEGPQELGTEQPTGPEMVEGEGEITPTDPAEDVVIPEIEESETVEQDTAPVAPEVQDGTFDNPHVAKVGARPGKFLDANAVSEVDMQRFLGRMNKTQADKLKQLMAAAKKLKAVADRLGVRIYFGKDGSFTAATTGLMMVRRNSASGQIGFDIYINATSPNVSISTISHELAHALLRSTKDLLSRSTSMTDAKVKAEIKKQEKEAEKLMVRISEMLNGSTDSDIKALSVELKRFADQYRESRQGEEFLVQFLANFSEGIRGKVLDNSILAKIERALNNFFDAILGKGQLQIVLTDTKDLIDFLNIAARGVVDGDAQSITDALELYDSGRVTNPRKTVYWKKQEIKNGQKFVKDLTAKINAQKNFNVVKDIEAIVNKILAQVFSPGKFVVKFNAAKDAAGFIEKLELGATQDKTTIKVSKDVAADMMVAINDHLDTVIDTKQQIFNNLTPEENADMMEFEQRFPAVGGITPEPTADERRVIEKLEQKQAEGKEVFGKMIDAVTVPEVANQDAIAGKADNTKMRMVQDRTGAVPNGLAGQLAVSSSPHGIYNVFETMLAKMQAVRRGSVSAMDAAKAIFAQAFDGKQIPAFTMFDKVRIIDEALIATNKEAGKEYYTFDGSGAASILLNSDAGQRFLELLSEGQRDSDFEAQAAPIIELYGIDPVAFFDRVYAAQNAFIEGGINAAEKSLGNNRSLVAAITGVGTLTKQEAQNLEGAIKEGLMLSVRTTGNARLDSRADAMASALNMDVGLARQLMYQLVGKHLTSELDHNAVDDAIDLSDMEFYGQLATMTDTDYDNGVIFSAEQRVGTGNMHNYVNQPYYDAAKDYVIQELRKGTTDKDIVAALSNMYPAHLSGFDAKNFFEGIAGRPYRSDTGLDDVSAAVFKFFRHLFRLEFGDARMVLRGGKEFARDTAYSVDYSMGNDLAPIRQIQRDLEKALGGLLPAESAAYQKMQLYVSAAASKIDEFTKRFYGDRKALRQGRFTDSFISRLTRSKVGSVNEFNTFLVNIHRWERIDRAIDIQQKFLTNMYDELVSVAQGLGITIQPMSAGFDAALIRQQMIVMLSQMQASGIKGTTAKLKIKRITEELVQLDQAVGLRDAPGGIVSQFRDYVREKKRVSRTITQIGRGPTAQVVQTAGLVVADVDSLTPSDLTRFPEFADHFTFYNEFKDMQIEYLDILRDAGHLNDERYEHLKNGTSSESDVVWQFYSPLIYDEFAFRDEMGFPVTSAEKRVATFKILGLSKLRRRRGKASPVLNKKPITIGMLDLSNLESPLEVFFHRMSSAIKFKERNDAINSLANMLEQTGSDKYANFAARYSITKDRWGTVTSANDLIPDSVKRQSVTYYKDGKRRYLFFADPNDPMLLKLNRGFDNFASIEMLFRHINNFGRAAFTYLNPGFIEASLFRDVVEAFTNLRVESRQLQLGNFKNKLRKGFIKNYGKAFKFFLLPMFKKDPQMAAFYQQIQQLGGFMSWSFNSMELLQDAEKKVKDNIAYAERYAQGRTSLEKAKMIFSSSLNAIQEFSNFVEMVPRLATYATFIEMGVDPVRAAEAAKNITVNFEKKGASNIIRQAGGLYLFLSPSIQGVRKFGKQLYSPEGRKYLLAYAGITAAARGLTYMMPYFAGDDEEKREDIANKIDRYIYSQWISESKVIFPNPFDPENPFTPPKPYGGFRIAAAMGEGMVDMMHGRKTEMDVIHNLQRQVKGAFDPIAGTSSYTNQWLDAMPLPLLHPVFENVANVDYMGRPILFDQSGSFDYLKANKSTAQIYHTIAQNVYRYTPGHIDISPTSYEHLVESYAGLGPSRIVTNFVKAYENFTDPESGKTDKERNKHFAKEIISLNRVLYNPNISEENKRDLYNYLSMASTPMGRWNEEKVKYAERAIIQTKIDMSVNPKVIQDSLDDLLSQIVFSGKLYQNVPGQDITWAQWYSAMSAIGDKRSSAQHRRYINEKISKALEESRNAPQEE